jgi:hypothetical protein
MVILVQEKTQRKEFSDGLKVSCFSSVPSSTLELATFFMLSFPMQPLFFQLFLICISLQL